MTDASIATRRVFILTQQLLAANQLQLHAQDTKANTHHNQHQVDIQALQNMLEPKRQIKDAVRTILSQKPYLQQEDFNLPLDQYRKHTQQQCMAMMNAKIVHLKDLRDDPIKFFAWFEALGYYDHSVALKFAVQYNLWGGTILFLGTERHHKMFLEDINSGATPGCFGLTELGHGSNVQGMETTATYDEKSQEFIIHSPTHSSQKYWPGNFGKYGVYATIFARMIIKGKDLGVHGFLVPIRDQTGGPVRAGITCRDIGPKRSFNGVDNAGLLFNNIRIPRENMLDRFSRVEADGTYVCKLPASQHFAATMSPFLGGRIALALLALAALKCGTAIAVTYSLNRRQFGPAGKEEIPIMEHTSHLRRLMPAIAASYAHDFSLKYVANLYAKYLSAERLVHVHGSGTKAACAWDAVKHLQNARECCGGQGFRMQNRIAQYLCDADLYCTGEGDNTVLMLQVTRYLTEQFASQKKAGKFTGLLSHIGSGKKALPKPRSARTDLLDFAWQAEVLQNLEALLLTSLDAKLSEGQKQKLDVFSNSNKNSPLALKLAAVHVVRIVQREFTQKIASCAKSGGFNGVTLRMLQVMCQLYTLQQIQAWSADMLANEIIAADHVKILDDTITELCRVMFPQCLPLVEAFGLPDSLWPLKNNIE